MNEHENLIRNTNLIVLTPNPDKKLSGNNRVSDLKLAINFIVSPHTPCDKNNLRQYITKVLGHACALTEQGYTVQLPGLIRFLEYTAEVIDNETGRVWNEWYRSDLPPINSWLTTQLHRKTLFPRNQHGPGEWKSLQYLIQSQESLLSI